MRPLGMPVAMQGGGSCSISIEAGGTAAASLIASHKSACFGSISGVMPFAYGWYHPSFSRISALSEPYFWV
jgi:hypothetical protein